MDRAHRAEAGRCAGPAQVSRQDPASAARGPVTFAYPLSTSLIAGRLAQLTAPLRFTSPIYHQKCTYRLISRVKMYCQKCRTPLRLDSSLEDLNPAAYDLLVGESPFAGPSCTSSSLLTWVLCSSIVASHCKTSRLFETNEWSRSS